MGSAASKVTDAVLQNTVSVSYVYWFLFPLLLTTILLYTLTSFIFGWPRYTTLINENACKTVKKVTKNTYKSGKVTETVNNQLETISISSPTDIPNTYRKCTQKDFKIRVIIGRLVFIIVPIILALMLSGFIYKLAFYAYNPHIAATMFVASEVSDVVRGPSGTTSSSNSSTGDQLISSESYTVSPNSNSASGGRTKRMK